MQNGSEQPSSEEAPLYIRWNPDRSPYAVEFKLDLVGSISNELARAEKAGIEVGGVLIGSLPNAYSATLRIEDFAIVPRGAEEGATFVLDPDRAEGFAEIRSRARARERDLVGFFRSHLRPGAMRPSLADRILLSGEFPETVYAVLLIEGREPYMATFFLAANGHLPGEASVRNFRFDENDFRALPEVQPEMAGIPTHEPTAERKSRAGLKVYGTVAALLLLAVGACLLMWWFSRDTPVPHIAGQANPLSVAVTNRGPVLRITWDHSAHELDGASGATMLIVDGPSRRELQLGVDELRLGAIEYERSGGEVQVTMTLTTPGSAPSSQTIYWTQH